MLPRSNTQRQQERLPSPDHPLHRRSFRALATPSPNTSPTLALPRPSRLTAIGLEDLQHKLFGTRSPSFEPPREIVATVAAAAAQAEVGEELGHPPRPRLPPPDTTRGRPRRRAQPRSLASTGSRPASSTIGYHDPGIARLLPRRSGDLPTRGHTAVRSTSSVRATHGRRQPPRVAMRLQRTHLPRLLHLRPSLPRSLHLGIARRPLFLPSSQRLKRVLFHRRLPQARLLRWSTTLVRGSSDPPLPPASQFRLAGRSPTTTAAGQGHSRMVLRPHHPLLPPRPFRSRLSGPLTQGRLDHPEGASAQAHQLDLQLGWGPRRPPRLLRPSRPCHASNTRAPSHQMRESVRSSGTISSSGSSGRCKSSSSSSRRRTTCLGLGDHGGRRISVRTTNERLHFGMRSAQSRVESACLRLSSEGHSGVVSAEGSPFGLSDASARKICA